MAKQQEEKQSFWQRYKFYIIGLVGAIVLLGSMSVQNVVVNYQTANGTQYAVKLDYSPFGMCLRCYAGTQNSNDIVEKAIFFGVSKEKSVERAAAGLQEIAGETEGTVQLRVGGLVGNNEKNTAALVEHLKSLGYNAKAIAD
jgi:hypothetical protein